MSSRNSDSTKARKSRRACPYLFLLGSGFEAGSGHEACVAKFVSSSRQLDCSKSQIIYGEAESWDGECRPSVGRFVRRWLKKNGIAFDDRRLLVRSYNLEAGAVAVAGYVPKSRAGGSPTPEAATESDVAADRHESSSENQEPDPAAEIEFAEASASEVTPTAAPANASESDIPEPEASPFDRVKSIPPKKLATIGGGVAILVLLAVLSPMLLPSGNDQTAGGSESTGGEETEDTGADGKKPLPPPTYSVGQVRIYTGTPGFHVLVDGNVVKDEEGNPVETPCAVTTEQGSHTIKVFREGYFDTSQEVVVSEDGELTFKPLEDPDGTNSDALNAPWRDLEIGKPVALESINSSRPEFDPYLTPDGLSLWFVGDRSEGRGIFVSTRLSPFHEFGEPQQMSRSADLPGTPSVTDDALVVAYSVPEKARLWSLTRSDPLGNFEKKPIRASEALVPTWASAQILGDSLRIYWFEITPEKRRTLMSTRQTVQAPFSNLYEFPMPGGHPCLSQDGLRHYVFDGKRVMRYRRAAVTKTFGPPTVITEEDLELPGFVPSDSHRQYFVSDDEQWLFYCDDPSTGGDLFAVRLSDGPTWGVRPVGRKIDPKPVEVVAKVDPEMQPAEIPEKPVEKPVDPRSLPLPYTAHWKIFKTLIANRQYEELAGLIQNAKSNPAMKPFAEQLAWDEEELKLIQQFWADVREGIQQVKKGENIRIANNRADFDKFEDDTIHAVRAGTPVRRKLNELRASELTQFFDKVDAAADAEGDYRAGVFLSHDRDGVPRSAETRLAGAGRLGDTFRERIIRRLLVQSKGELERSKFGEGVAFLKEAEALAKGLPIADEITKLEESLYEYVKWRQVGGRAWAVRGNSYDATLERKPGALLLSELEYENVEISLEWKTQDSPVAMGGVYFRYSGQGNPSDNAFKIQLANDAGIAPDNFSTGSLFTEYAPDVNAAKPAGEWNTLHIHAHGPDLVVTINGKKVLEAVAVAPDKPKKGYVALDGVAGGITYRRILVSELPK